jgi:hypothetical protein
VVTTFLVVAVASCIGGAIIGLGVAWWRDQRAAGALRRVERGRGLTVPAIVSVAGSDRRSQAVVDDGGLWVVGPRTQLSISGPAWASAAQRRHHLDEELLEMSTQRGFVDAAGTRYLVGVVEEWDEALAAAVARPARPASAWRRRLAAAPRLWCAATAAGVLAVGLFQLVWALGEDVTASVVRVLGDVGYESCAVRWDDDGRSRYAEVDCYPPFPQPGGPLVVRGLAWPFEGKALDHEGTYEALTVLPAGLAVVAGTVTLSMTGSRLRRPAIRLTPAPSPRVEVVPESLVTVERRGPLTTQLHALSALEGWADGVTAPPPASTLRPYVMAATSARWWPGPALAAAGWLLDDLPGPARTALFLAAAAALLWAVHQAASTWVAIRPAFGAPVTSEWEYHLLREPEEQWIALLLLGGRPHWLIDLLGPGHPQPRGWCGVRGDLRDGGAVQLVVDGEDWMCAGPVVRVDDDVLSELTWSVADRLGALGGQAPPSA